MEDSDNNTIMSSRLEKAMIAKALNGLQLAERVGVSRSAMSFFLRGKRRPGRAVLAKIADQLSVTVDYLLGRSEDLNISELLENPRIVKLVKDFSSLEDRDQKRVLDMIDLIMRTGLKRDGTPGIVSAPDDSLD